jgi:2-C-methyl-D-erythritol 4-phosphate cytidylyltransferase
MSRVIAIIPAAGTGQRLGEPVPKALVTLHGSTLLTHTLRKLRSAGCIDEMVVAYTPGFHRVFEQAAGGDVHLVEGGSERQQSVALALRFAELKLQLKSDDFVLIHDAARCLIEAQLVCKVVRSAKQNGAASLAVPAVDSLVKIEGASSQRFWGSSVDRKTVWQIQTPQVFRFDLLQRAHAQGGASATDDASLVAAFHSVALEQGSALNMKVTTAEDLKLAALLLGLSE